MATQSSPYNYIRMTLGWWWPTILPGFRHFREPISYSLFFSPPPSPSPPTQSKYEGQFSNGHYEGYGVFTKGDGMKYEGEFRGGKVCFGVGEGAGLYRGRAP